MSTAGPVPAPSPIQPQESSSPVMRVLQTIYAPTKAFTNLKGATAWIAPWIVISIISLAFFITVDKKITFDTVIQNSLNASPKTAARLDQLSEAQKEQQIHIQVLATKYICYASPITTPMFYAVIALVLWGTFTFGCGARLNFGTSFSVAMLAGVPGTIKMLLAIVAMFAGADPDGFNINNPLATNLSFLFDRTKSPFLYTLGSTLDIFLIWFAVLLAIGFSTAGKVKRSTAFSVIFGWLAVIALASAGIAALF